jgi:hypothetical protein
MILFSLGCSFALWVLSKFDLPFLARVGRYAWRCTFWRYIFLYMPFVWVGWFRSFSNLEALSLSVLASLAQIGLTYTDNLYNRLNITFKNL